jgi:pimeloyl-ACP methyl ester carboxylesterase
MKARFNGVDLYLETRGGGGPSIVLVHGSWGDHHNWGGVVPLLARSCRVTTYDRRGHSQSERLATQGSIRDDVRDLAALIEGIGIAPAHVVGNSFGAIVTLNLIIERPDLVASAVIHEPPLIGMLEGNPALSIVQQRVRAVIDTLNAGNTEAGWTR